MSKKKWISSLPMTLLWQVLSKGLQRETIIAEINVEFTIRVRVPWQLSGGGWGGRRGGGRLKFYDPFSEYYRTDTYFFTFLQNISKYYPTDISWLLLNIFKYYPKFWNRTSAGQTDPNLRCLSINTLLEAQHPVALCKWYKPVTLHLFCHFLWYFIANTYTRYSFNHSYLVVFFVPLYLCEAIVEVLETWLCLCYLSGDSTRQTQFFFSVIVISVEGATQI